MKTTPEFTDAEIQDMMDFRQVLSLTEAAQRRSKIVRRIATTILITGLVGGSLIVYDRYLRPEPVTSSSEQQRALEGPEKGVDPAPSTAVPADTITQSVIPERREGTKKPAQKPLIEEEKAETASRIRVDSAMSVFVPAEPANGYPALYEYFAKELHYPPQAIKDSIQGVILVSFVINTQGSPERVETDHVLGEAFEKEAMRLIENMPAWKPAQLDGSPVSSKVSVPITFTVKTGRQR